MPRRISFILYTIISSIVVAINGLNRGQQIPLSHSHLSQDRPSWSTLPVSNPTKSFWVDTPNANPLAREGSSGPLGFGGEDIDVCIIGSGITGISAVHHLQRFFTTQGKGVERKIVVLEAREFCECGCASPRRRVDADYSRDFSDLRIVFVGSGATGRNGGHLTPIPFSDYAIREKLYGKDDAKKSYELEGYVVSSVVNIIHSHGWSNAVDLVDGGHVMVFLEEEEARKALVDYKDAKRGGLELKDVTFLDQQTMLEVCVSLTARKVRDL
jgi:hypothetical protein